MESATTAGSGGRLGRSRRPARPNPGSAERRVAPTGPSGPRRSDPRQEDQPKDPTPPAPVCRDAADGGARTRAVGVRPSAVLVLTLLASLAASPAARAQTATEIWSATLTADTFSDTGTDFVGFLEFTAGMLDDTIFMDGDIEYQVLRLALDGDDLVFEFFFNLDRCHNHPAQVSPLLQLHIGTEKTLLFSDLKSLQESDSGTEEPSCFGAYRWLDTGLSWSSAETVQLRITTNAPGPPKNLTVEVGYRSVTLKWEPPDSKGSGRDGDEARIVKYQYRHRSGDSWSGWTTHNNPHSNRTVVRGLTPGTAYEFQIRAHNDWGPGPAASATATPRDAIWYFSFVRNRTFIKRGGEPTVVRIHSEKTFDADQTIELQWDGSPLTGDVRGTSIVLPAGERSATTTLTAPADGGTPHYDLPDRRDLTALYQGKVVATKKFTVYDDETKPAMHLSTSKSTIWEGESITLTLGLEPQGLGKAVDVELHFTDTGSRLSNPRFRTIKFGPGEKTKTVTIGTKNDNDVVHEHPVSILLKRPTRNHERDSYVLSNHQAAVSVTIQEDDATAWTVGVGPGTGMTVAEAYEEDGHIDFMVWLSDRATRRISVDYETQDGTAKAGSDYKAKSGSLDFRRGDKRKTVRVNLIDDNIEDSGETFRLKIKNPWPSSFVTINLDYVEATILNTEEEVTESDPLTANFTDEPASHDGSTIFNLNLSFSENVTTSYKVLRDQALSASNGTVLKCHRVDGRNDLWKVHIEPASNDDITVTLSSPSSDCDDDDAVCTADDKLLSNAPTKTIPGPSAKVVAASAPPGLAPNAPNPFNASTIIPYHLATPGAVRLEIYNLLGQPMRTLVDQVQDAGFYRVSWNARDQRGAAVAAGVYLVRLQYPGSVQTRRLLYLK